MFKLIHETDPLTIGGIVTVVYGEPGIGKTSLSFTADNAVHLDFDGGVQRSVGRKLTVSFESWEDVIEFHNSEEFKQLNPQRLIFDTAGSLLDKFLARYVIRQDQKNGRAGGELSLQGYGAMKSVFSQYVAARRMEGKDLIFICHQEQFKDGDDVKNRPKMTGGSYDMLIAEADLVGFMQSRNNRRTINFNPTDHGIGKNTAEFSMLEVPHYESEEYSSFLTNLINLTKEKMQKMSASQEATIKMIKEFRHKIADTEMLEQLIELGEEISKLPALHKAQLQGDYDKQYYELFGDLILGIVSPEQATIILKSINSGDTKYQKTLQNKLKGHIEQFGFTYNSESKEFSLPEAKKDDKAKTEDTKAKAKPEEKKPVKAETSKDKKPETQKA